MMNKILTIVIPTYNMEKYLDKCLTSLVIEDRELMKQLEILVVIDGTQTGDQLEGLRGHEAAGAGFLGAIADGVEADVADVRGGHLVENRHEVFPTLVGIGVDVHLLRGEAHPDQARLAGELVMGERQARTRTVDAGQVLFGGAVREHGAHGEEHRIVFGLLALGQHVLELLGFPTHVVDDGVDHDVVGLGEFGDVVPAAETFVDLGVIDRPSTKGVL